MEEASGVGNMDSYAVRMHGTGEYRDTGREGANPVYGLLCTPNRIPWHPRLTHRRTHIVAYNPKPLGIASEGIGIADYYVAL